MPRTIRLLFPALIAFACSTGCKQSVNIDEKRDVSNNDHFIRVIDGPKSEQRIRVQVTATTPVHVCIMLEKDANEKAQDEIEQGKAPKNNLGFTAKTTDTTLVATIPAKEAYRIWVAPGPKTANVTLKVNSI